MNNLVKITMLASVLLSFLAIDLQAQFIVSGEFRPRLEYRDGYSKLRDSSQIPYPVILGRNRLIFDYKSEKFMAKFSIQQAYVFGENNYSSDTITRNTVNIYEAWFSYRFTGAFSTRIGRTELVYDDSRLFGNSNWSPKAASHDVAVLEWTASVSGYKGDLGLAINNSAPATAYLAPYPLKNYKYMAYLYEQKKFFKDNLVISLLAILDVFQKPAVTSKTITTKYTTLYVVNSNHDTIGTTVVPATTTTTVTTNYPTRLYGRFTIGGTAGYTLGNLKLFANSYYQGGHFSDGRTISAGFFGGHASYKVVKPLTLMAGYEWFSGNDFSDTTGLKTKTTSFSTLYGSNHGFYGYMDLFSSYVTGGNSAGLTDLYVRATLSVSGKTTIEATYRMFGLTKGYLASAVKKTGDLPYVAVGKNLGSELDMMVTYKVLPNFEVNGAYCFFLPTSTMERLNGLTPGTSKWAQYAYLMLTWKPAFFNSDKH